MVPQTLVDSFNAAVERAHEQLIPLQDEAYKRGKQDGAKEAATEIERLQAEVQSESDLDKCYEVAFNNACIVAGLDGLSTLDDKEEELASILKAAQIEDAEFDRLQAIVDELPKDAEGVVYPPPKALRGKLFYHPEHLGPAPRLFSTLFWHPDGHWGLCCGSWEVPLAECYSTRELAEMGSGNERRETSQGTATSR